MISSKSGNIYWSKDGVFFIQIRNKKKIVCGVLNFKNYFKVSPC